MNPRGHRYLHEKFTISKKLRLTENQQEKAIKLLKVAWVTVDFWDHNGDQSKAIVSFINEVEGHTNWPRWHPVPK